MANDDDQNERIRENREAIRAIEAKVGAMETTVAVVQSEVVGLRSTVTTGFLDLKEVIVHRADQDAAESLASDAREAEASCRATERDPDEDDDGEDEQRARMFEVGKTGRHSAQE